MNKNKSILLILAVIIINGLIWTGCMKDQAMTQEEQGAVQEILPESSIDNVEKIDMNKALAAKFPAVDKMFKITHANQNYYVFAVSPVGYQGPIDMVVIIDDEKKATAGIKVLHHEETPEYGESLTEKWFAERFKGKTVNTYLQRVILEANKPNEVMQITGCTVSSQAAINGVNSAIGAYHEGILKEKAEAVPLNVEDYITAG